MRRELLLCILVPASACGGDGTTNPPTGGGDASVSVTVKTTLLPGAEPDPDGFRVFVDGDGRTVGLNETVSFASVPAGNRTVTIADLADHCAVTCGRTRTTSVSPGQTVTETFEVTCAPPPKGRIAFGSGRAGIGEEIYVIQADGSGLTRLTHDATPGKSNLLPRWSPDGSKILLQRQNNGDIHVMNADGSGIRNLTNHPADESDVGYSWSPDGEQIVFGSDRDDPLGAVYVMNTDGSDQRMIANEPGGECCMDWSPDGSTIVFEIETLASQDVHLMDAEGSDVRLLTPGELPSWSPDGGTILFARGGALHTIDVDGSCETRLPVDGLHPTWSPDGFYIAYTGADGVYIANLDGSNQRNLTGPTDALERMPSWTR